MTIEGTNNLEISIQNTIEQQDSKAESAELCRIAEQQIAKREYPQALASYQQAIKISSTCIDAYLGMADLFRLHGNHNNALQLLSHALKIEPENSQARRQMAPLLSVLTPSCFSTELEHDLVQCLSETDIDHQILARAVSTHISNKYPQSNTSSSAEITLELLRSLNKDLLFLSYLTRCINTHAGLEQWLTRIRKTLLQLANFNSSDQPSDYTELQCAIALQCFSNEYVFDTDEEELQLLAQAEKEMSVLNNSSALLTLCMYRPLFSLVNLKIPTERLPTLSEPLPYLDLLLKRSLYNLQEEQQLQACFPSIGNLSNNPNTTSISDKVRDQYEENPYPRWQIPPAPVQIPLTQVLNQLPGVERNRLPLQNISVLIAGCGTGFEPIELARMDKNARITALDLSTASLAYAKRMSDELHISNVSFIQGNILDATQLNEKFDLINSTGVLHHMEYPLAGWQVLCALLKSGGLMRISLYSELARRRIVPAHQRMKELKLGSSVNDIKAFRNYVFAQPSGSPLAELAQSDDFYSVSGCRDLLFHVQEHRFTLPQLKKMIAKLELNVVGFDVPAWALQQFQHRYPQPAATLDLEKWHEFEVSYPDTFIGMYQIWLQKK